MSGNWWKDKRVIKLSECVSRTWISKGKHQWFHISSDYVTAKKKKQVSVVKMWWFLQKEAGIPRNIIKVEDIPGLSKSWFYSMVLLQFVLDNCWYSHRLIMVNYCRRSWLDSRSVGAHAFQIIQLFCRYCDKSKAFECSYARALKGCDKFSSFQYLCHYILLHEYAIAIT